LGNPSGQDLFDTDAKAFLNVPNVRLGLSMTHPRVKLGLGCKELSDRFVDTSDGCIRDLTEWTIGLRCLIVEHPPLGILGVDARSKSEIVLMWKHNILLDSLGPLYLHLCLV
jgi:hypothetical protein